MLVPTRGKKNLLYNNSNLDESVATFGTTHSFLNASLFLL